MTIERPDLASAFSGKKPPVDRAATLTGLLPPPRPRPSTSPSTSTTAVQASEVEPSPASIEPDAGAAPTAPKRETPGRPVRTIKPTKTAVSETADVTANIAVYLEPDLYERVRTQRRIAQVTYDELVVAAFAAVPDHELQQALAPAPAASPVAGMPVRQRRPRGTAGIQIQLRLNGHQRVWLDEKQHAVGAPSRSALVAAALRLYLTD